MSQQGEEVKDGTHCYWIAPVCYQALGVRRRKLVQALNQSFNLADNDGGILQG